MQAPDFVARDEAGIRQSREATDRRVDLKACGLGAGVEVPQPDGFVQRARGEPPVGQHAQRRNQMLMPFEASGHGAVLARVRYEDAGRHPALSRILSGLSFDGDELVDRLWMASQVG